MTKSKARWLISYYGLSGYTLRELRDLLDDKFYPLPGAARDAIKTLLILGA